MLNLEIVTPQKIVYSESVDKVSVPSTLGTLGILPNHSDLFALLSEGEIKVTKENRVSNYSIGGGFIEVSRGKAIVLVSRAVHASELAESEILSAQSRAKDLLSQKPSGEELVSAQALLHQSITDLRILRKSLHERH